MDLLKQRIVHEFNTRVIPLGAFIKVVRPLQLTSFDEKAPVVQRGIITSVYPTELHYIYLTSWTTSPEMVHDIITPDMLNDPEISIAYSLSLKEAE